MINKTAQLDQNLKPIYVYENPEMLEQEFATNLPNFENFKKVCRKRLMGFDLLLSKKREEFTLHFMKMDGYLGFQQKKL